MATKVATVINLVNTAIGAGLLALPYAFKAQGILLGIFSLIFGGLTTIIGLLLLSYSSGFLPAGKASFFEVAKITYPSLAVWFDIAISLKCFGVCVSYLVIIADLMPMITNYFGYETSRELWTIVTMFIVTPLSYQRSLESLKTASIIALSSVVYLIVIVVGHYIKGDTLNQRGPISILEPQSISSVISSVPIIVFAYTCAQNLFSSINELETKSMSCFFQVSVISVFISGFTYILVGITGYLSFGDNVGDNVISMYAQSFWSTLGRFSIVVLVMFSYPLMCHPCRSSISNVLRMHRSRSRSRVSSTSSLLETAEYSAENNSEVYNKEHIIITTMILVLSFILANTLKSLELILSFVGATGATSVSFIFPGLFGYALSSSTDTNALVNLSTARKRLIKYSSIMLFIWGGIVAILAIGANILRIIKR